MRVNLLRCICVIVTSEPEGAYGLVSVLFVIMFVVMLWFVHCYVSRVSRPLVCVLSPRVHFAPVRPFARPRGQLWFCGWLCRAIICLCWSPCRPTLGLHEWQRNSSHRFQTLLGIWALPWMSCLLPAQPPDLTLDILVSFLIPGCHFAFFFPTPEVISQLHAGPSSAHLHLLACCST